MDRKMATIRKISDVVAIPDAEFICAYVVDGWKIVDKVGKYSVGELVVMCEIDSWIPSRVAPFLTKPDKFPKEYNGVQGERLKTIRLRGQLSQGLVLPLSVLGKPEEIFSINEDIIGLDVSEQLGIIKWEPPEDAGTVRNAKGSFPHFLRKTDQERVQNLTREIAERAGESFEVTVKIDGSSLTAYHYNSEVGVCSRNIELKEDEGNAFWAIARKEQLLEKLQSTGRNLAIQGELTAPNIQSNHERVTKPEFHCFSIFDIDSQEYLLPEERRQLCATLGIPHVKIIDNNFILCHTVDQLLEMAEGEGMNQGVKREGLVFKSNVSQFSFKTVSNTYLLKRG